MDERAQGAKEQPAMEYGAIDLHTKESQIRIIDGDGAVVVERRIATTRPRPRWRDNARVNGAR